jgi:lipid-A-disaccharide synthase
MKEQHAPRLFFVAGEPSGDLHGSLVISHLKRHRPDLIVDGIGGMLMKSAGQECIHSIDELAVIGFVEVIWNIRRILQIFADVKKRFRTHRPDMVVLIDYPGFNMRVAEAAKAQGIHVVYYICPQVWAWHASRVNKITKSIHEAIVVFPFEVDIWQRAGAEVNWFGHPLVGIVESKIPPAAFRASLELGEGPVISLLPGSRNQEIFYILPGLVACAERILREIPSARFLLPMASTIDEMKIRPYLEGRNLPIKLLRGQTYEAVQASDLALVASGTATLETAILGTPMIIVYQTNWITSLLSRFLIQAPHIGLPNVITGEKIVPEFIRWKFNPELLAAEALSILRDPGRMETMRKELVRVRNRLGEKGAGVRVADHLLRRLQEITR